MAAEIPVIRLSATCRGQRGLDHHRLPGFVSTDYGTWGGFPIVAFFFSLFIGGCTGSTSGSIKIFRWQMLFLSMRRRCGGW